ncbi:MAG: neutral/alkaline ceramidase [Desulfobacterales bacterium]|nr:neutral/alkaline ceramidase [Desulfobacterales bacterium]
MISPTIDLSQTTDNTLSFWVRSKKRVWLWSDYYNHLYVYVSNDNGSTWTQIDHLTKISSYTLKTYDLENYITPTPYVKIKFKGQGGNADDNDKDTFVDDVKITGTVYTPPPEGYEIGTGIYDITGPAAEVGMMGYSMPDQKTEGIHMRLRSRAYAFHDLGSGKRAVFVSADIGMIFQAVKQKVVEKLQARFSGMYDEKNVLLSASHTHSGPGGYSHYAMYNLASLGFVEQNFNAITEGIFQSIVLAHNNLAQGNIYINEGELRDCGWNRSPNAYEKNPTAEKQAYGYDELGTHGFATDGEKWNNTDKYMTLLKLTESDGTEIGMINWYAVHPTNIGNTNKLISSDNKGYASYLFEKDKGTDYLSTKTFAGSFAQTNSGDVSPNVFWGYPEGGETDFDHMKIMGQRQYEKAAALYTQADELLADGIDYRHMYIDFSDVTIDPAWTGESTEIDTCTAAIGLTELAGSEEDGTGISIINEGMAWGECSWPEITLIPEDQACHAEKIIFMPSGRMLPYPWVPEVLPVQILKIGNLAIVGVPFEITTMAGRRLEQTVADELESAGVDYVVIAALSNAYSSYLTTREEYSNQDYEGGSSQFGPYALNAAQQAFAYIAGAMRDGTDVSSGPEPRDLSDNQIELQTGVVLDDIPLLSDFGDVESDANSSYVAGQTVSVVFWGGHPKNDLLTQGTFLTVEKNVNGSWVTTACDWDPETRYYWARSGVAYSKVTITWDTTDAESGEYRIRHFGHWKSGWTGDISSYTGTSRTFTVVQ